MITFNIAGKKWECPTKWEEVTLNLFQKISSIPADSEDAPIKIVNAATGIHINVLILLPYSEVIRMLQALSFVFEEQPRKPIFELEILGVKYKMLNELGRITWTEYIHLDTLIKDKDNVINNLHTMLAILYRPIIKDKNGLEKIEIYDSDKIDERAEIFKKYMTCDYAISAMLFSLALAQTCSSYIRDCSESLI